MSFLAPLFLLGAAAVALPVVFHLIRRSSRDRVPFSSLMFLLPTPPRVTRRSKLENIFLLILRCAVICLLATAFARPFFSKPVAPDPAGRLGRRIVLLVDTSASMRRPGLWAEAQTKARNLLASTSQADQLACFGFDREMRPLVSFEQWNSMPSGERGALVAKRLTETAPSWASTRLGTALISACEMLEAIGKEDQAPKRIVVISDLQEGSRLDGLQGFEWPRAIEISFEPVQGTGPSNAGLQLAGDRENTPSAAQPTGPRVRVTNASGSKREQFKIGWGRADKPGFVGATLDTYIPPGQSRVLAVPAPSDTECDRLLLTGDEQDFDNTVYVVPQRLEETTVLFLGPDQEKDPNQGLFYVERAFQQSRGLKATVSPRIPGTALSEKELSDAGLIMADADLPEDQIRAMKAFAEKGKAVLVIVRDPSMTATLSRLLGVENIPVEEMGGPGYALLGQIDFQHPLFAAFADPRYSDFTKIQFWKHRRIGLDKVQGVRVLARFDNGDVALAEVPSGQGRIWILSSSWQRADSQLALSSKFVPLLYAMLEQSHGIKDKPAQYWVGDAVPLPPNFPAVTVRKPDASEVRLVQGEKFTGTDEPGIYTINSLQPPVRFAVNVAPEESRTAPMALEDLERLGVPVEHQLKTPPRVQSQHREHLQAAQLENRQKLWRWLIVGTLVVLVIETWLAGRLTRSVATASS